MIASLFQSTLPGWGATVPPPWQWSPSQSNFNPRSPDGERLIRVSPYSSPRLISIHAPRMGSDLVRPVSGLLTVDFNPRSPDGERHSPLGVATTIAKISIHAPRMGSDRIDNGKEAGKTISIHAPRMGSDRENGHLRPRYGQNHPFSTLIVSQIVIDVLGTVRKSQKTPAH